MDQSDMAAKDRVRAIIGTEEEPDLDATIRDGECPKSIVLSRRELSFWHVQ